jgi:hypothetical protein
VRGFFRRISPEEKAKDRFSLRLTRSPKKRSYTNCPWCSSQIELARLPDNAFHCPICRCAFRHNYAKWGIALPLVLALCVMLLGLSSMTALRFVLPPIACVFMGVIVSVVATRRIPDFNIIVLGTEPPPTPTQSEAVKMNEEYQASCHISIHRPKQLAAALTFIFGATCFILLLCWLISLLML